MQTYEVLNTFDAADGYRIEVRRQHFGPDETLIGVYLIRGADAMLLLSTTDEASTTQAAPLLVQALSRAIYYVIDRESAKLIGEQCAEDTPDYLQ